MGGVDISAYMALIPKYGSLREVQSRVYQITHLPTKYRKTEIEALRMLGLDMNSALINNTSGDEDYVEYI